MSLRQRLRSIQKRCWDADKQPVSDAIDPGFLEQRHISRRISIWITYFLVKRPSVTPDHVTTLWLLLGLLGVLLLGCGIHAAAVAGAVCLYLTWHLDCVDGEVSRDTGIVSIEGNFIDMVGHHVLLPLVFAALTFDLAAHGAETGVLALGLLAAALITPLSKISENTNSLLLLEYLAGNVDHPFQAVATSSDAGDGVASSPETSPGGSLIANCRAVVSFVFSQCCRHYLSLIAVLARQAQAFVVFSGVGLPLFLAPKFLSQRRQLGRKARDPALLRRQFRDDWGKASTPGAASGGAAADPTAAGD